MGLTIPELLQELDAAIAGRSDLPVAARTDLAARVAALREGVERERAAESAERHQLGHDLRAHLNAIAGWAHILRLESTTPSTVGRAAEIFDRNVRTLTSLIETYTTAHDR